MPGYDSLYLENQLCFALYAATNAITRSYRDLLSRLGLTYPQYLVVVKLIERGTMTSGELARALRLDAGTLTPMLKRLAAAGIIERTRRANDERVIDNRLTEAGLAIRDELKAAQRTVQCRLNLEFDDEVALRSKLHTLVETLAMPQDVSAMCEIRLSPPG